jgi:putative glutamine amidotransferase
MSRPVVGIISNSHLINDEYPAHSGGTMNSCAVAHVAGCLPLLVPSDPSLVSVAELLDTCDGFLLTGGRPNVHPEEYGEEETPAHGAFDRGRDAVVLPSCGRWSSAASLPRSLPGLSGGQRGARRHAPPPRSGTCPAARTTGCRPDGTLEEKFALRHKVTFAENGPFHRLWAHARS